MIDDRNAFHTQEKYARAYIFAATAHHGQLFPGSELPYLLHISLVGAEVLFALIHEDGLDAGLAVQCALLHDVLEDTPISFERLAEEFGEEVANGVLALTKRAELPWEARMPDSLSRILRQPREIAIVKLADRIVNMSPPPGHWPSEKRRRYHAEAQRILDVLGDASEYLSQRLRKKMDEYRAHF
ncbi:MAG TPA: HD domain-containing protein [Anaerolineales bacterium]|jgi:(p)ppGpp synthase/HD superfamily hydrolase|nr:HD domain-containing protein [Anaerolineales bacterium]